MSDYTLGDFAEGLGKVGVSLGDLIFVHSNVGFFGECDDVIGDMVPDLYATLRQVIGNVGTICVPEYTHNPCGLFSHYVAEMRSMATTGDRLFNVAVDGPLAGALTDNLDNECFGANSFWGRFLNNNGKFINFNFDSGSTFIHWVERQLNVPYRKDRLINGMVYFSRDLNDPSASPRFERFDHLAREQGLVQTAKVGRGSIVSITAKDTYKLISEQICIEPNFLIERGAHD